MNELLEPWKTCVFSTNRALAIAVTIALFETISVSLISYLDHVLHLHIPKYVHLILTLYLVVTLIRFGRYGMESHNLEIEEEKNARVSAREQDAAQQEAAEPEAAEPEAAEPEAAEHDVAHPNAEEQPELDFEG